MEQPALSAGTSFAQSSPFPAALRTIAEEVRRDGLLYGVVGAYLLAVWALAVGSGRPQFYQPLLYMTARWPAVLIASLIFLFLIELPAAIFSNPHRPLTAFGARLRSYIHAKTLANLILFLTIGLFVGGFTSMKGLQNVLAPFWADTGLARFDAWLDMGVDPWRLIQPALGHHTITRFIQMLYLNGWVVLLVGFTAAAAFSSRLAHVRSRFFLTYLIAWIVLGNLLASLLMSGGPTYFPKLTGDQVRFADQVQYLSFSNGMPYSSTDLQRDLWTLYASHRMQLGAGISAFPSIHVATATLYALMGFCIHRLVGWATAVFAVLIFLGSVHLGWHYAIDGYASAAFVLAVWFGLGKLTPKPAA